MYSRDQIILEIIESFFNDILHLDEETVFEFDNPTLLKNLVVLFIANKAQGLSDEDLLSCFGDNKSLLDDWLAFLKAKLETLGKTIH